MSSIVLSASVRPEPVVPPVDGRSPGPRRSSAWRQVRRSTRPSTTRPTSSPHRGSITAPAISATSSTASITVSRCCRRPIPASPRCRSRSTVRSRSRIRRSRPPSATRPSRTSRPRSRCDARRPARNHQLHQRGRLQQRAVRRYRRRHDRSHAHHHARRRRRCAHRHRKRRSGSCRHRRRRGHGAAYRHRGRHGQRRDPIIALTRWRRRDAHRSDGW